MKIWRDYDIFCLYIINFYCIVIRVYIVIGTFQRISEPGDVAVVVGQGGLDGEARATLTEMGRSLKGHILAPGYVL